MEYSSMDNMAYFYGVFIAGVMVGAAIASFLHGLTKDYRP